jgi:manganese/zinc/iron transport system permease protein
MSTGTLGANTLGVLAGCVLFGALAGAVGTFVLARRRALVADVAGHAALPGIAIAFLMGEALGLGGRTPWLLLAGGACTALLAAWCVAILSRWRRVGPDGALAVSLAGFFGLGAVLFSVVQSHPAGSQGGLRTLLLGSAAAMGHAEVRTLAALACAALVLLLGFYKELALVAFDEDFARTAGLPVRRLDLLLTLLLVASVVAGMQLAGIVLVVAMLIAPAAAARNIGVRTQVRLGGVTAVAALIGAISAAIGVLASRSTAGVPTGAAMTLAAATAFLATIPLARTANRSAHA